MSELLKPIYNYNYFKSHIFLRVQRSGNVNIGLRSRSIIVRFWGQRWF